MMKNEYKTIRLIGEGSFGSVFKVRRKLDQQIYAMKKVHSLSSLTTSRSDLRMRATRTNCRRWIMH
jgi:serine/threonine protein kinase